VGNEILLVKEVKWSAKVFYKVSRKEVILKRKKTCE
jgi:hypothetical protein